MALGVAIVLTVNGMVVRHYIKILHMSPLQLTFDGGLFQMVLLMILYIIQVREYGSYTTYDLVEGVIASILAMFANVTLSKAYAVGLGGPVTGINNLASVVQTIMAILILGQSTTLMQNLGLASGILGALVISEIDKIFTCPA